MNTSENKIASMVGVSDCITESLSVDVEAVPTAGGGVWQNYKAGNTVAKVTGEAYLTPENEGQLREGSNVAIRVNETWLGGRVTTVTDRADARGRTLRQYGVVTNGSEFPTTGLQALYVPRWQRVPDRAVLRDWSGNGYDMRLVHADWSDTSLILTPQTRVYTDGIVFVNIGNDVTIIAKRTLTISPAVNSRGVMVSTLQGVIYVILEEFTANGWQVRNLGRNTLVDVVPDGWSYYRRTDYNRQPLDVGANSITYSRFSLSGTSGVTNYSTLSALAIWSRRLSDAEIKAAEEILDAMQTHI